MIEEKAGFKGLVKKHPLAVFIILTFSISYLLGMPFNMLVASWLGTEAGILNIYLPRLLTVAGPGLSAVMVAFWMSGQEGVRELTGKLRPDARHFYWWILLPSAGIVLAFSAFVFGGLPLAELWALLDGNGHVLLAHLVLQTLLIGIGEELGWRGWLLPHLAEKKTLVGLMVIIFLVWGLWHFPILFMGAQVAFPWLMILFSMTVVTTWLWYRLNGNVFVLAIAHASVNAPEFFLENAMRNAGFGEAVVLSGWEILGYLYLLLGAVILVAEWRLWK